MLTNGPFSRSGKGSGAGKTEKRLKAIKLEKKREAMSMGDTSLSKNFNERASRTGEAFMILSSGNKACVFPTRGLPLLAN